MKQLVQSVNAESHRARFKTHEELQKTTNSLITEATQIMKMNIPSNDSHLTVEREFLQVGVR
jgi:hypothetical protein